MNTKKWDTTRKMKCLSLQPTGSNVTTVKYHRTYSCVGEALIRQQKLAFPLKASITIYVISLDGRTNGLEKKKSHFFIARPQAGFVSLWTLF